MIAALMELTNGMQRAREAGAVDGAAWAEAVESLLLMMAPACPHIAEELWERSGREYSVHQQSWPEADADLARSETIELAVQVNGKVRARLQVVAGSDEDEVRELAEADGSVAQYLAGKTVRRVIFVPDRLLNIVVG